MKRFGISRGIPPRTELLDAHVEIRGQPQTTGASILESQCSLHRQTRRLSRCKGTHPGASLCTSRGWLERSSVAWLSLVELHQILDVGLRRAVDDLLVVDHATLTRLGPAGVVTRFLAVAAVARAVLPTHRHVNQEHVAVV